MLRVSGLEAIIRELTMVEGRTKANAARTIRRMMIRAQKLAIQMAPVDEANLEKAIKVAEFGGGRGADGRFMRKTFELYVDGSMPANEKGKTVGDYAYIMHEHLTPYGPKQLGPRSQAKNAANGGKVGGMFLIRAALEVFAGKSINMDIDGEEDL